MIGDARHPFFRPLWRRIAVLALCFSWSVLEWANGETFWGVLTLAIGAYGVWVLFIAYDGAPEDTGSSPPTD